MLHARITGVPALSWFTWSVASYAHGGSGADRREGGIEAGLPVGSPERSRRILSPAPPTVALPPQPRQHADATHHIVIPPLETCGSAGVGRHSSSLILQLEALN